MRAKQGERVYAVLSAPAEEVFLLGFGVYVGDEVSPEPMGVVRALFRATTWEEFDRVVAEDTGQIPNPDARPTNPKIVLDDGTIVWGAECWWGPEPLYAQFRGNRREPRCSIVDERRAVAAQQSATKTHIPLMHGDLRGERALHEPGDVVLIPAVAIEFREGGNTLLVHGPEGGTILRLKTLDGTITSKRCQSGVTISRGDAIIQGDLEMCLGATTSTEEKP
jgi:hypothetical protein